MDKRRKCIIAGSRTITDFEKVAAAVAASGFESEITEVVSGGAAGVDFMGELWANRHNLPIKKFLAAWALHGKSAGAIRNREMAEYADALIAVWDGKSRGTKHMIECANGLGLRVFVYQTEPTPLVKPKQYEGM